MAADRIIALRPSPESRDLDRAIGRAIARFRRASRLSPAHLANLLGRSETFVRAVELGDLRISPAMVVAFARALGTSGSALLRDADEGRRSVGQPPRR